MSVAVSVDGYGNVVQGSPIPAIAGYKPIALAGYDLGGNPLVTAFLLNVGTTDGNIYYYLHNGSTAHLDLTIRFDILYVRTTTYA